MHSYRWCGSLPSTATTTTATTMIRRLCCLQSVSPSLPFSSAPTTIKKPLVLLGAPQVCLWELMLPSSFFTFFCFISFSAFQVSAIVLDMLLNASASPHSLFEVLIIYTRHFLVIPRSFHVYLHCVCNMQFIRLRPSWLSHLLEGTGARSSPSLPWPLMLLTEASPPISFSPPLKLETYLTFLSYSVYCVFFFPKFASFSSNSISAGWFLVKFKSFTTSLVHYSCLWQYITYQVSRYSSVGFVTSSSNASHDGAKSIKKLDLCETFPFANISGTVNIHRSLLPLHRGVVPVQRALQVPPISFVNP